MIEMTCIKWYKLYKMMQVAYKSTAKVNQIYNSGLKKSSDMRLEICLI